MDEGFEEERESGETRDSRYLKRRSSASSGVIATGFNGDSVALASISAKFWMELSDKQHSSSRGSLLPLLPPPNSHLIDLQ